MRKIKYLLIILMAVVILLLIIYIARISKGDNGSPAAGEYYEAEESENRETATKESVAEGIAEGGSKSSSAGDTESKGSIEKSAPENEASAEESTDEIGETKQYADKNQIEEKPAAQPEENTSGAAEEVSTALSPGGNARTNEKGAEAVKEVSDSSNEYMPDRIEPEHPEYKFAPVITGASIVRKSDYDYNLLASAVLDYMYRYDISDKCSEIHFEEVDNLRESTYKAGIYYEEHETSVVSITKRSLDYQIETWIDDDEIGF